MTLIADRFSHGSQRSRRLGEPCCRAAPYRGHPPSRRGQISGRCLHVRSEVRLYSAIDSDVDGAREIRRSTVRET